MAALQIPIGMHGIAEAARERRSARRAELEAAFLAARREATLSDQRLQAAAATSEATLALLQANTTEFRAARDALEVEIDVVISVQSEPLPG